MKGNKKLLIVVALLLVAVLGFVGYETYARYFGGRAGSSAVDVAYWNVQVDGEDVNAQTPTDFTKTVTWLATDNVVGNLIAPNRKGTTTIAINPNGTEVAINYYIKVTKPVGFENANIKISDIAIGGTCSDDTKTTKETCEAAEVGGTWTPTTLALVDEGKYDGYYTGVIELPGEAGAKTAMTEDQTVNATINIEWEDKNTVEDNATDTTTGKAQPAGNIDFEVIVEQKVD